MSIQKSSRDYSVCARQYRLSPSQNTDYFVNVLDYPTRKHFFSRALDFMTFEGKAYTVVDELNCRSSRLQVYGKFCVLRIENFILEYELNSLSKALTKVVIVTKNMAYQCRPHFRSQSHKIVYLRGAVTRQNLSCNPLYNIATAQYIFKIFNTALRERVQLEYEIRSIESTVRSRGLTDPLVHQYARSSKSVRNYARGGRNGMPSNSKARTSNQNGKSIVVSSQRVKDKMNATNVDSNEHLGINARRALSVTQYASELPTESPLCVLSQTLS